MLNDLQDKEDSSASASMSDPAQAYYDRELEGIAAAEKNRQRGTQDKEAASSEQPSAGAGNKAERTSLPASSKGIANPTKKDLFKLNAFLAGNRRKAIAGVFGGGIIGAVVSVIVIASGPAQLFRLGHLLGSPLKSSEDSSSIRVNALYRAAKTGNIGETRISWYASKKLGPYVERLNAIGIEFNTNATTGTLNSTTFDTNKLSSSVPELKGMTPEARRAFLANKFNIEPSQIRAIGGNGTKFAVVNRNFGIGANRIFVGDTASLLGDGKITTAMKARVMQKFFNVPSWLHPFKRAIATKETQIGNTFQAKQRAENQKRLAESRRPPPTAETIAAEKSIKEKLTGVKGQAGSALLVTGVMCIIRDVANDVITVNRNQVAVPAALAAGQVISMTDQPKSLQDMNLGSFATAASAVNMKDANGKTLGQSMPLMALEDPYNARGEDLSAELKQGFSSSTTAQTLKDTIGGGLVGAVACSDLGVAAQFVGGLAIIASSIPTGGGSAALFYGVKTGVSFAVTGGAIYLIQKYAVNALKSEEIVPEVLAGPVGGGLLAYGAKELQATTCRASGCVAISKAEAKAAYDQRERIDAERFRHKNMMARVFDIQDNRSLASSSLGSLDANPRKNITNAVASMFNFKFMTSLFASLLGGTMRVSAATPATTPYDFGSPDYAIPRVILNDPEYLNNPYGSHDKLAAVLESSPDTAKKYADRAMSCFGNTIRKGSKGWEAVATKDINPSSEDYINAHCDDLSDKNWQRMILFVNDSRDMDAIACFVSKQGDADGDEACANNGIGESSSTAPATGITSEFGGDTSAMTCSAGTDAGIGDGYDQNKLYKIRLCNVQGIEVNAQIAGNLDKLMTAAKGAGLSTISGGGFRTMEGQIAARQANGCPDIYNAPAGSCRVDTARPGYSNHQMGLAVDFKLNGKTICFDLESSQCRGNALFDWLKTNATSYGLKNLPRESWHWSVDGK